MGIIFYGVFLINDGVVSMGAMVAAVLREEGFEVKAAVNTFKNPLKVEDYVKIAKDWGATHVGISMYTMQVLEAYKIVKEIYTRLNFLVNCRLKFFLLTTASL